MPSCSSTSAAARSSNAPLTRSETFSGALPLDSTTSVGGGHQLLDALVELGDPEQVAGVVAQVGAELHGHLRHQDRIGGRARPRAPKPAPRLRRSSGHRATTCRPPSAPTRARPSIARWGPSLIRRSPGGSGRRPGRAPPRAGAAATRPPWSRCAAARRSRVGAMARIRSVISLRIAALCVALNSGSVSGRIIRAPPARWRTTRRIDSYSRGPIANSIAVRARPVARSIGRAHRALDQHPRAVGLRAR